MAQDRIWVTCSHCGASRSMFKIVAGGESEEMLKEKNTPETTSLRDWMGEHIAHNPLAYGWLVELGRIEQWFIFDTESEPNERTNNDS